MSFSSEKELWRELISVYTTQLSLSPQVFQNHHPSVHPGNWGQEERQYYKLLNRLRPKTFKNSQAELRKETETPMSFKKNILFERKNVLNSNQS